MGGSNELKGPDLSQGIPASDLADGGTLVGHANGEGVLLARRGDEVFAVGASCTHYGGALGDGIVAGDTVRCPLHHACFSLRTGEALRAPALNPIPCFDVQQREGKLYVLGKSSDRSPPSSATATGLSNVVIIGGGAAGQAAAEMLRRRGYVGKLTMLSADDAPPCDRPNLSKDYLAGNAPEEWIPLRPPEFFQEHGIDLVLNSRVTKVDVRKRSVETSDGKAYAFDALLLATGAEPNRLSIPGADLPHVHTLRSLSDSRAIIAKLATVKRAVVVGASFIGLEVAASLRARNIEVHVVGSEARPLERVLGAELGDFVRKLHEEHGVVFHLGKKPKAIDAAAVTLESGEALPADLVVLGVGVKPALALAESAGLKVDRGVVVNESLETSALGVFAAGDIARWPNPHSGENIRVEHWVVAQRQGQIAAENILSRRVRCDVVPFFWSQHYDVTLAYTGHAETWDRALVTGNLAARDATVELRKGDKALAVITVGRDKESLKAELAFEKQKG